MYSFLQYRYLCTNNIPPKSRITLNFSKKTVEPKLLTDSSSRSTDLQSPELSAEEVAAMFITLDGLGVAQINLRLNILYKKTLLNDYREMGNLQFFFYLCLNSLVFPD